MKKLSTLNQDNKLTVKDTINYIDAAQLREFLKICSSFITAQAKTVINYLIDHNGEYVQELGHGGSCALVDFMNDSTPSDPEKKELYKAIEFLNKDHRLKEIPCFMSEDEFNQILSKKVAPDLIFLSLDTEEGRNIVAKRYEPLVHKIAKQFYNVSNYEYEDIKSAAMLGLTYAMNNYGKRVKSTVDDEQLANKTFTQVAAYYIRNMIITEIRELSRTVRIPVNVQQKERKETGHNVKSNTVSGNKHVGNSDDEGAKTLFDYIPSSESSERSVDMQDADRLWEEVYDELEKKFSKEDLGIWYSVNGLRNFKKIKQKDIAELYGVVSGSITYRCNKIVNYLKNDPKMRKKMEEIYLLMNECQMDYDNNVNEDTVYTSSYTSVNYDL